MIFYPFADDARFFRPGPFASDRLAAWRTHSLGLYYSCRAGAGAQWYDVRLSSPFRVRWCDFLVALAGEAVHHRYRRRSGRRFLRLCFQ